MLDYMFEGYGYDMDNQLLYTSLDTYNESLSDKGISTNGMETLLSQKILTTNEPLETEKANKYTEVGQFVSEHYSCYTDLRWPLCGCCNE